MPSKLITSSLASQRCSAKPVNRLISTINMCPSEPEASGIEDANAVRFIDHRFIMCVASSLPLPPAPFYSLLPASYPKPYRIRNPACILENPQ